MRLKEEGVGGRLMVTVMQLRSECCEGLMTDPAMKTSMG